ncbi:MULTISPECIES: hypothetical protein [unclassified Streptomyces]|uniref:hypothetical protein n=1 Tax=unclassified Streptomyces TaxID=2593676 RepID=UPI0033A6A801
MTEPMAEPTTGAPDKEANENGNGNGKKKGAGRVLLRVVLPSVLVLGLIGGGVTYTALTVSSADRTAPTQVWGATKRTAQDEDPAADGKRGKADTPLSKLLLPLPEGYEFGPDEELYGNDGELGAAEAAALMKRAGEGLSGKKRRAFEKNIDKLGIQGVGVRTFADPDNDVVVSLQVARMKDKKQIKDSYRLRKEVMDALEFPKGPRVKDHRNAVCYTAPENKALDKEERAVALERMICVAYDAEVSVTLTAAGAKPFDEKRVADLLKQQLDHIESPGEYV